MSQKISIGASAPQVSQHAVARGQGVLLSRRLRVAVFSIGVLLFLIKFLAGLFLLDFHIDVSNDNEVDPDDVWNEVSQRCLVVPCGFGVQELDVAERLF